MKTASSALASHLQQHVTTLCTCWTLTRRDGVQMFFTDHDLPIVYAGNTYQAESGYTRSAISSADDLSVDNMSMDGIFSSAYITEADLRNGVYDYAEVQVFMLNWANLSMGIVALRTGWFGEVTINPTGTFQTELRGLTQLLNNEFGNICSPKCRADLGDSKCTVPIDPPIWTASTAYAQGAYVKVAISTTPGSDPYAGVIWQATTGGTSTTTQPAFSTAVATIADGSVVWTKLNSYTKQGAIVAALSRNQFQVRGLLQPNGVGIGPDANQSGVTSPVQNASIPTTGYSLDGNGAITLTVTSPSGNSLYASINVQGAGANNTVSGVGTSSLTIYAQPAQANAILTTLTWNNSSSLTDLLVFSVAGNTVIQIAMPQVDTYFDNGTMVFVGGQNNGRVLEIYTYANGIITTRDSVGYMPAVGDVVRVYPGCNKTRSNCLLFQNVINFRGEPDLPGQDYMTSTGSLTSTVGSA